jgi:outer membrane protein
MKKVFTLAFFLMGSLLIATRTLAQQKMGYISLEEVIASMPETKKADSSFTNFREAMIQSENEKQQELNQKYAKFIKDSVTMPSAKKEIVRKELQEKLAELQGADQRVQEALQKKQEELSAPIQKKAVNAVQEVAKENGYTYVFLKQTLLVAPPANDLLALVKKKLGVK